MFSRKALWVRAKRAWGIVKRVNTPRQRTDGPSHAAEHQQQHHHTTSYTRFLPQQNFGSGNGRTQMKQCKIEAESDETVLDETVLDETV
jgi:hypothetical protein